MVTPAEALPGRAEAIEINLFHYVSGARIVPPFPEECQELVLGLGCFWGAERLFWKLDGVYATAVGYAGGFTNNPTYEEVCTGLTGHTEVVKVVYDPKQIKLEQLLRVFWEAHDPTQGMWQGNDCGTQYRSAIYCSNQQQLEVAEESRNRYQQSLEQAGYPLITTEIECDQPFYYAEEYHQQYLAKNPGGYCGLGGTGVLFE